MKKHWFYSIFWIVIILFLSVKGGNYLAEKNHTQIKQEVNANTTSEDTVILGGMPIGIYLETDGVMVLGTDAIMSIDGMEYEPAENLVKPGDYIVAFNRQTVENKTELIDAMKDMDQEDVILRLRREDRYLNVRIKPVVCSNEEYKLGIWVRDDTQGLGTITYLQSDCEFGALGHGIHDVDTNELLEISEGTLYETSIRNIKKGETGTPGGMEGVIVYNNYNILGDITQNTDTGVYGKIKRIDRVIQNTTAVPAAKKEEIKTGPATILCAVSGQIEAYEIEITGIDYYSKEINKGILLKVTDDKLLEQTGGIVQGMSGSPIIQDGKLVGAVTHVLVNDPTKGYGIFIENMLEH